MDAKLILGFLRDIKANNNREWFHEHRDYYDAVRKEFESGVGALIARISTFDPTIAHVTVKDASYRFYRDTRFSPDKSPYKRHLGAYIAAHGKKSFHGGYYIHLEPDNCFIACGAYCLPTNILTACRNEIMANTDAWLSAVENDSFLEFYGGEDDATMDSSKGFGLEKLKTRPSGFPADYEYINYLRMKDYCCWHHVDNDFFGKANWLDDVEQMFKAAKPMLDFTNSVIDDYE